MAILGIGSAGALATLTKTIPDRTHAAAYVSWLALVAAGAIFLLFLGIAAFTDAANQALDEALSRHGIGTEAWQIPPAYLAAHLQNVMIGTLLVGILMFIPYLLLGLVLSLLFRAADKDSIPRMYATDLIGACGGAVLAIIALDYWAFTSSATFAIMMPLLAAICLSAVAATPRRLMGFLGIGVASLVFLLASPVRDRLEPAPHLPSMGRTPFMYQGYGVKELWHTWTSYGRVAAVEMTSPDDPYTRTVMVHGSGEGHARVFPSDDDLARNPKPIRILHAVRFALAGCTPGRVLVLLAGAGADMVLIDRLTGGRADITGVELIPEIFRWPQSTGSYGLAEFFDRPNIRIVGAEGREFLARDKSQYDCIIFSWSGASRGYFTGVSASAPGYLMTEEGLDEILDHLAPGGQFTMLAGNRTRMMMTLAKIMTERGTRDVRNSFVLTSMYEPKMERSYILSPARNTQFLMIKPAGFSEQDIRQVNRIVEDNDLYVIYHPNQDERKANAISRLLASSDPFAEVNTMLASAGANFYPAVDDRPFATDPFSLRTYLSADFWLGRYKGDFPGRIKRIWRLKRYHMIGVLGLTVASIFLILLPLIISYRRQTIDRAAGTANHIAYFACLGAAFMFIEMGLIQKLRLLVGHPGQTIAIVLASVIFFTGIGSFLSNRLFSSGLLTFRRAAIAAAVVTAASLVLLEILMPAMVGLPRSAKLALAFLAPAVAAFFMGQLFPQGLAALTRAERMIPLCMGANAMTGTIAAGLGVALAPIIGFNTVVLLGCAIYLIVAVMPHQTRTASDSPPLATGRRLEEGSG